MLPYNPKLHKLAQLYVAGFPTSITTHDLFHYFQSFGEIEEVVLPSSHKHSSSQGYAVIHFVSDLSVQDCLKVPHTIGGVLTEVERVLNKEGAKMKLEWEQQCKVHVGDFPKSFTQQKLYEFFGRFGKIDRAFVLNDPRTGERRDFAYVRFAHPDSVTSLLRKETYEIEGKTVKVQRAVLKRDSKRKKASTKRKFKDEDLGRHKSPSYGRDIKSGWVKNKNFYFEFVSPGKDEVMPEGFHYSRMDHGENANETNQAQAIWNIKEEAYTPANIGLQSYQQRFPAVVNISLDLEASARNNQLFENSLERWMTPKLAFSDKGEILILQEAECLARRATYLDWLTRPPPNKKQLPPDYYEWKLSKVRYEIEPLVVEMHKDLFIKQDHLSKFSNQNGGSIFPEDLRRRRYYEKRGFLISMAVKAKREKKSWERRMIDLGVTKAVKSYSNPILYVKDLNLNSFKKEDANWVSEILETQRRMLVKNMKKKSINTLLKFDSSPAEIELRLNLKNLEAKLLKILCFERAAQSRNRFLREVEI